MDVILSVGGSIVVPEEIDVDFLKAFRKLILDYVGKTGSRVVVTVGGGKTCRTYQQAAGNVVPVEHVDLDWVGIKATALNAELVRAVFSKEAYEEVIIDPTQPVSTDKKILVACGWKPGCSTDKDAVLLGKTLGIKTIVNMTNTPYVCDKDPAKYEDAKPLKEMTWDEMVGIVGTEWVPGMNLPFDPIATGLAKELGFSVVIMKGTDLDNFKKYLSGEEFEGTTIKG